MFKLKFQFNKKYLRRLFFSLIFLQIIFISLLFKSCDLVNYNYVKKQNVIIPEIDNKKIKNYFEEKNLDKIVEISLISNSILTTYKKEIIDLINYYYNYSKSKKDFFYLIKLHFIIDNLLLNNDEVKNINLERIEIEQLNELINYIRENLLNIYNNEKNYIFKHAYYKYLRAYFNNLDIKKPEIEDKSKLINSYSDIIENMTTIYNDKGFKIVNGVSIPDIFIGTGFYIDFNILATNAHVIDNEGKQYNEIYIIANGNKIKGEVIYIDKDFDIALVKVNYSNKKFKFFNINENISIGDEIIACGSPYGLENTFTRGIISNKSRRVLPLLNAFQSDVAMNPGNSGGPVIDKSFNLVGISFASVAEAQNLNFIIPVEYFLATMIYSKYSYKPLRSWLGFYFNKDKIAYLSKNNYNFVKLKSNINYENKNISFKIKKINNFELSDDYLKNHDFLQKYIFCLPAYTIVKMVLIDDNGNELNYNFLTYNRPTNVNYEIYKYDSDMNLITPYLGIIFSKSGNDIIILEVLDDRIKAILGIERGDLIKGYKIYIDEKKEIIFLVMEISIKSKGIRSYNYTFVIYFDQEWFI